MKRICRGLDSLVDTRVGVGKGVFVAGGVGDDVGVTADAQALNSNRSETLRHNRLIMGFGLSRCGYDSTARVAIKAGMYLDSGSSLNGYYESGWMGDYGDIRFDSANTSSPHGGTTAISVTYSAAASQGQHVR